MKILIVEDNYALRKILLKSLEDLGECHVAVNGVEAIEAVKNAIENNDHYHLITMDIMMPGMNGVETLKKIRDLEYERHFSYSQMAKVIMSTALNDRSTILKSFHDQCDGYIVKPVAKTKLIEELKKLELIPS